MPGYAESMRILGEAIERDVRKGTRWIQSRSKRQAGGIPTLPVEEAEPGRWMDVSRAVATFARSVPGLPAGAGPATALLQALYGIEDPQAVMLRSIDRNVKLLREGPFQSGQLLLSEVRRKGESDPEYGRLLRHARDHFFDAWGLSASIQERALVEFYLACTYALEGSRPDAEHWLAQSYASARVVVIELGSHVQNTKVLHSQKAVAATYLTMYPSLVILPAKLRKVWKSERAAKALSEFLPFENCVANSLNSLSPSSKAEVMELVAVSEGAWELR